VSIGPRFIFWFILHSDWCYNVTDQSLAAPRAPDSEQLFLDEPLGEGMRLEVVAAAEAVTEAVADVVEELQDMSYVEIAQ
jgi:hypothetical protein